MNNMQKTEATPRDFENAVGAMSVLRFFPSGEMAITAIIDLLRRLVSTREQLTWLVGVLIDQVGEWPGSAQLRALFCTRFPPADGVEGPACTIAGYTPEDGERKYLELQAARVEEQKLLPGEVSVDGSMDDLVLKLAKVRQMPSTPRTRLARRNDVKEILSK